MAGWSWEQVVKTLGRGQLPPIGRGYGALQEVRAYWEGLRDGTDLPRRASLDPRGMGAALEHVFLVERIDEGVARVRLAGMHLTTLMGMEVRGMPLTALFEARARTSCETLLEGVFSGPALVELALETDRGGGAPLLDGRMILLPLAGNSGACDRALGCLVTFGKIGRAPRRFAIARQRTESIDSVARPASRQSQPALQPTAGFAESPAIFAATADGNVRAGGEKPYLRLVSSRD